MGGHIGQRVAAGMVLARRGDRVGRALQHLAVEVGVVGEDAPVGQDAARQAEQHGVDPGAAIEHLLARGIFRRDSFIDTIVGALVARDGAVSDRRSSSRSHLVPSSMFTASSGSRLQLLFAPVTVQVPFTLETEGVCEFPYATYRLPAATGLNTRPAR